MFTGMGGAIPALTGADYTWQFDRVQLGKEGF